MDSASSPAPAKCSPCVAWIGNGLVLLATFAFFLFMTWVCYGHTFEVPENVKWALAALTSAVISGTFWIAAQGFRVAITEHFRVKKHGPV